MGREVRMVTKDWIHPKDGEDKYLPLYEGRDYDDGVENYKKELKEFRDNDFEKQYPDDPLDHFWYCLKDWCGNEPVRSDYMPDWKPEDMTHYMMYQNTSEGTPISPSFETPEKLAQWLVDNNASSFAHMTSSYESWLSVAKGGYAPSMVIANGTMKSGVDL